MEESQQGHIRLHFVVGRQFFKKEIIRWASSHADKYLIISIYGLSILLFEVMLTLVTHGDPD